MLRHVTVLTLLLACLPAAWGQEKKADAPPKKASAVRQPAKPLSPAMQEYQALLAEVRQAQAPAMEAVRAAADDKAREAALEAYYKKAEPFAPRFIEFAKKHADDPAGYTALVYVVGTIGDGPSVPTAIDMLFKDHSTKLAQAATTLARGRGTGPETLLRAIVAKNKDGKTLAAANFGLGQLVAGKSEKVYEKQPKEAEKLSADAEKHFALVTEKYANDDPALATRAKGELFKLRNLAIGKVVPEIEGEDTDGKRFKLSDYRGKVVVLDFWGHW
jgi:hypothetical protein